MSIQHTEQEIIDEFALFDSWDDKYEYIIDLGKKLPPMPESLKTDENRIMGCQSKVWVDAELKDNQLYFYGDSEPTAQISKGLVGLLIRVLSGEKPEDIANAVHFLSSPLASAITGICLPVDCGLTAGQTELASTFSQSEHY